MYPRQNGHRCCLDLPPVTSVWIYCLSRLLSVSWSYRSAALRTQWSTLTIATGNAMLATWVLIWLVISSFIHDRPPGSGVLARRRSGNCAWACDNPVPRNWIRYFGSSAWYAQDRLRYSYSLESYLLLLTATLQARFEYPTDVDNYDRFALYSQADIVERAREMFNLLEAVSSGVSSAREVYETFLADTKAAMKTYTFVMTSGYSCQNPFDLSLSQDVQTYELWANQILIKCAIDFNKSLPRIYDRSAVVLYFVLPIHMFWWLLGAKKWFEALVMMYGTRAKLSPAWNWSIWVVGPHGLVPNWGKNVSFFA